MSCPGLLCEIKSPRDGEGGLVKPLDQLFTLEVPSRSHNNDTLVSEKTSRHREVLRLNRLKSKKLHKAVGLYVDRKSMRKFQRFCKVKVKGLQEDMQQLTGQSRMYRDTISQLQSSFCDVLHVLRKDNDLWKMIHFQKVPMNQDGCVNDLSDTCERMAMSDKINKDITGDYLDAGERYSHYNGKRLSRTNDARYKRRRRRCISYIIGRCQRSVVTVARENNDLKSTFDVLTTVNEKLKKEVGHLQKLVHSIDLSKPVAQPASKNVSRLTAESVPSETQFALEVQKCAMNRSFMTPLPGFLNPVVNLECQDRTTTHQNGQIPKKFSLSRAEANL